MKLLAIRTLSCVLLAVASAAATEQYGGFASAPDGVQAYLDYLHRLEMIPVVASDQLQQAIKAIPVESNTALTSEQEAGLRAWLYDFLVAFSSSGNDSLAAAFYLREGVNNPAGIDQIRTQFATLKSEPAAAQFKSMGMEIPEQPVDDTPFALFQAMHKFGLAMKNRTYFFGNISFFASKYKVFKSQGEYESYRAYVKTHDLLPIGAIEWYPKLRNEIEEAMQAGTQRVFARFMFIVEEPEEFASFEGAIRHPFFAQLVWSPEQNMWRLVEAFAPNNTPSIFLFNSM